MHNPKTSFKSLNDVPILAMSILSVSPEKAEGMAVDVQQDWLQAKPGRIPLKNSYLFIDFAANDDVTIISVICFGTKNGWGSHVPLKISSLKSVNRD